MADTIIIDRIIQKLKNKYPNTIIHYSDYISHTELKAGLKMEINLYVPTKEKNFVSRKLIIDYPRNSNRKSVLNYLEGYILKLHNNSNNNRNKEEKEKEDIISSYDSRTDINTDTDISSSCY